VLERQGFGLAFFITQMKFVLVWLFIAEGEVGSLQSAVSSKNKTINNAAAFLRF
jgi:hypothetical protein